MTADLSLLAKYNKEIPRYTSYPTVPFWADHLAYEPYLSALCGQITGANKKEGIALYIHLPFCDTLCTYCGCNKIITANHEAVEDVYIDALLKEWSLYNDLLGSPAIIREMHLGGGTPTYFSGKNLARLLSGILGKTTIHPEFEGSIEGHPNNTMREHLAVLRNFGFKRISYDVQDHNPHVQRLIHRVQPLENVMKVTKWARAFGFSSVNYDLIYGLPGQTIKSITTTIKETIALQPDRIAFYSYAHVPWKAKGQRLFNESDLPSAGEKLLFYQLARKLFLSAGYRDIGMDHFALPQDNLYKAFVNRGLHRNFMGYTVAHSKCMIGLGVSSISDIQVAYAQNTKSLAGYYNSLKQGVLPIQKGIFLDALDQAFRTYILDIACNRKTRLTTAHFDLLPESTLLDIQQMVSDGLIEQNGPEIKVLKKGLSFLRNSCHLFDLKGRSTAAGFKHPDGQDKTGDFLNPVPRASADNKNNNELRTACPTYTTSV